MLTSVRLDKETESLLLKTAEVLNTTRTEVLKASIHTYCKMTLRKRSQRPYDLISDLIGEEFSGQGDLGVDGEEILRKAFRRKR